MICFNCGSMGAFASNSRESAEEFKDMAFGVDELTDGDGQTHEQILKSSALFGGSSALIIGILMVRNKALGVFLGPAGYGLFGVYGSLVSLAQSVAGLGVSGSGVRQIAQAAFDR